MYRTGILWIGVPMRGITISSIISQCTRAVIVFFEQCCTNVGSEFLWMPIHSRNQPCVKGYVGYIDLTVIYKIHMQHRNSCANR